MWINATILTQKTERACLDKQQKKINKIKKWYERHVRVIGSDADVLVYMTVHGACGKPVSECKCKWPHVD